MPPTSSQSAQCSLIGFLQACDAASQRPMLREAAARVGRATHLANHQLHSPVRDAAGMQPRATRRQGIARVRARHVELRPPDLGGHCLRRRDGAWCCCVCMRCSTKWGVLAPQRCSGDAATRWAMKAEALAEHGNIDGGGHRRMLSGDIVWCARCGAYASERARGLAAPCPGKPQVMTGGGRG